MDGETLRATVDTLVTSVANALSPAWVVAGAGVLASLLGFHALLGTPVRRWLTDLPFAIGGFAIGNFVAFVTDWPTPTIGDVHPVEGALGSWLVLGAIATLSAIAPNVPERNLRRGRLW
jgi:hypothetical protein